MSSPRLIVEHLTKSFFGVRVLHEISFDLQAGEVLGFVGENGSGKSTTMNILAGILIRDSGTVLLEGHLYSPKGRRDADAAGIAFIQQELSLFPNLSVAENLFLTHVPRLSDPTSPVNALRSKVPSSILLRSILARSTISRSQMRARTRELLGRVDLEVHPDAPAGTLSPGERQLLEIARSLATDARIIIFDEPTTSLSHRETERLFEIINRLRTHGTSIIYISHALQDVIHLSDRIVIMRDGRVIRQTPCAGIKADDLVVAMVGRSIATLFPERPTLESRRKPILQVDNVGEPAMLDSISFDIHPGEIVGLAGLMGAGRTELARILFGLDPHTCGTIRFHDCVLPPGDLASRVKSGMAFLTEDRRLEGLMLDATAADNMALAALPLFTAGLTRAIKNQPLAAALTNLATRLNLRRKDLGSGDLLRTVARNLSGGNQQKLVLARWLLRQPHLFLLDEPTRGVDVGAKEEIYRLLAELAAQGMAMLVISSELEELLGLADRILVLHRGRIRARFERPEFDRERILRAAFGGEQAA